MGKKVNFYHARFAGIIYDYPVSKQRPALVIVKNFCS